MQTRSAQAVLTRAVRTRAVVERAITKPALAALIAFALAPFGLSAEMRPAQAQTWPPAPRAFDAAVANDLQRSFEIYNYNVAATSGAAARRSDLLL